MDQSPVLLTGATGYVGGRLAPRLLAAGHRVRAVGRSIKKLACRPWAGHPHLELVQGDVLDAESLVRAARGCRAAYYLVHSMNPGAKDFAAADRRAAVNMAAACGAAGVERIIYLGGIVPRDPDISHHLRSRAEVGHILAAGPAQLTWLRAAMILGSGSASFELLRYLADRLPVMITPRWVHTRVQPIAISNVLGYLQGCLEEPATAGQGYDIGGPEVTTYAQLFQLYARRAGLRPRLIIPVPYFSPKLSSYWIHLVTPVPASLARPLAEGLRNEVVCADDRIASLIPQDLLTCDQALTRALERLAQERVETCWLDAGAILPPEWRYCADAPYAGGTELALAYSADLAGRPEDIWPTVKAIGGHEGWWFAQPLWRLRGALDEALGGVGLRRGRRHPRELGVGDAVDFWRVLELEAPRRLLLLAEMKNPGQAVLEIRVDPMGAGESRVSLIARFLPRGLGGILYWYALDPAHKWLYQGMLKALARRTGLAITGAPRRVDPDQAQTCRLPARGGK